MAAIPFPDRDQVPGLAEVYERIAGIGRPVLNLYKAMAHSPEGLNAYIGLSRFVRDQSSLPAQLRELATVQTAVTLGCAYELAHHSLIARQVGISDEQLQAVQAGRREPFTGPELAVLDYAREVGKSRSASPATIAALRQHLSLRQISDLALTVGMYHLAAAVLMPLSVDIDAPAS